MGSRGHDRPERRIARIHAGTLCRDAVTAAAAHGLTLNHGSSPDVSLIGYLLRRRLGLVTRGATGSHPRHCELRMSSPYPGGGDLRDRAPGPVLGAPRWRWVPRDRHERGPDLLPIHQVYAGLLAWDRARAEEVLAAWIVWTGSAPDAATTSPLLNLPPLPQLPDFAGRLAVVDVPSAAMTLPDCLWPLRALAPRSIPRAGSVGGRHAHPPRSRKVPRRRSRTTPRWGI